MSVETRTPRWAPETDLQWGLCHLDKHRDRTTGTSGALTLTLLQLVQTTGSSGQRGSLASPNVFYFIFIFIYFFIFFVLSPMEFCFLVVVASGLLSWGHFISSDITNWLHRYYLNWTELDNDITKFNNGMPLTQTFSCFDIVQLLWHSLYC